MIVPDNSSQGSDTFWEDILFWAVRFRRCVVNFSLVDSDFHGHRLALYRLTPFRGSHGRRVRHRSWRFGSSHSANSVYQKWPTCHSHSTKPVEKDVRPLNGAVIQVTLPVPPVQSLRVGRGRERSQGLQSFALPDEIATIERQLS